MMRFKNLATLLFMLIPSWVAAQNMTVYVKHSSGLVLTKDASSSKGVIVASDDARVRQLQLKTNDDGTCNIVYTDDNQASSYLALSGSWNTTFQTNADTDEARFTVEAASTGQMIRLRCKKNGKYLGTDNTTSGSSVFADKDGADSKHWWYLAETADQPVEAITYNYLVSAADRRQVNEGWGVSLCWWANMCGKWSDDKIDQIIDWLVSPTGLNYNIFRYNIGGGDDPENRNCTLHHMGNGKGLRAEMEGFKDSTEDSYHWDRDAAQRKIMLKIKEKRPDAIFEAFSNSCPYYMTYSGCVAGATNGGDDNLRPEYYEEFAHYLVDVCKHYKDEYGIEFKTLEPFNEPNTNFWYASGVQEGCHFGFASQIAFLKVLAPILQESGLNTIIAAADETSVNTAVDGFKEYEKAGVLDLVVQWNTHTYSGSNTARAQFGSMARDAGKRLWMSEVGSGGSGINGNLNLMQRLMDDVRYIMPQAWIDWQYVEENGDQWCTVRGSFKNQTYERVKSYYVHQHLTRFIRQGYTYISSLNAQTLAAISAENDTLVLVALNNGAGTTRHNANIFFATPDAATTKAYVTTASRNLGKFTKFELQDGVLSFELEPQSIVTFVIPVSDVAVFSREIETDVPYLIIPQYNTETALTVGDRNSVVLGEVTMDEAQQWTFTKATGGMKAQNGLGKMLYAGSSTYELATSPRVGTTLSVKPVEDYLWRIMTSASKALELKDGGYTSGTVVGHAVYGNSVSACHRNWHLLRLPQAPVDAIRDMPTADSESARQAAAAIYDLSGRRLSVQPSRGIYLQDGKKRMIVH